MSKARASGESHRAPAVRATATEKLVGTAEGAVFTIAMAEAYFGAGSPDRAANAARAPGAHDTCGNAEADDLARADTAEAWFRRIAVRFGVPYEQVREAALDVRVALPERR